MNGGERYTALAAIVTGASSGIGETTEASLEHVDGRLA